MLSKFAKSHRSVLSLVDTKSFKYLTTNNRIDTTWEQRPPTSSESPFMHHKLHLNNDHQSTTAAILESLESL